MWESRSESRLLFSDLCMARLKPTQCFYRVPVASWSNLRLFLLSQLLGRGQVTRQWLLELSGFYTDLFLLLFVGCLRVLLIFWPRSYLIPPAHSSIWVDLLPHEMRFSHSCISCICVMLFLVVRLCVRVFMRLTMAMRLSIRHRLCSCNCHYKLVCIGPFVRKYTHTPACTHAHWSLISVQSQIMLPMYMGIGALVTEVYTCHFILRIRLM